MLEVGVDRQPEHFDVDILRVDAEEMIAHVAAHAQRPAARRLHGPRDVEDAPIHARAL